jgi:hypothetical protein
MHPDDRESRLSGSLFFLSANADSDAADKLRLDIIASQAEVKVFRRHHVGVAGN